MAWYSWKGCLGCWEEARKGTVAKEKAEAEKIELELQIELLKAQNKLELQEKCSNGESFGTKGFDIWVTLPLSFFFFFCY